VSGSVTTPAAPKGPAPRPIILDCDPGHDDALAMLLALARPEVRLLAVTTVGGNADVRRTTPNRQALSSSEVSDQYEVCGE